MEDIDNITFEGKNINLRNLPIEELNEILNKLNTREDAIKQEIDKYLSELV